MRQITLAGARIQWPSLCACCLAPVAGFLKHQSSRSQNYLVVKTTSTLELEVPYCTECMSHVQWNEATPLWVKALLLFLITGLVGLILGLGMFFTEPSHPVLGAGAFAAPFVLTGFFLRYMSGKRPPPPGPEHAGRGAAIAIGYFSKESTRLLVLNDRFAEALLTVNAVT